MSSSIAAADAGADSLDAVTASNLLLAESEFVQSFAQPAFLQHLARSGQFSDPNFVARLVALHQRWSQADRAAALRYPMCLEMLRLASSSSAFRDACADEAFSAALRAAQFGHWVEGSPIGPAFVDDAGDDKKGV